MSRPRDHEPHPLGGGRPPSDRSVGRLRLGLAAELSDLHETVDDELRLAQVLCDAGEADAARLMLERPTRRLDLARDRLCDVVAQAAVERAAEEVLAGVGVAEPARPRARRGTLRRAPVLLSIVIVLAALTVGSAPDVPRASPSVVAGSAGASPTTDGRVTVGSGDAPVGAGSDAGGIGGWDGISVRTEGGSGALGPPIQGRSVSGPAARRIPIVLGSVDPALLALRETTTKAAQDPPSLPLRGEAGATVSSGADRAGERVDEDPDDVEGGAGEGVPAEAGSDGGPGSLTDVPSDVEGDLRDGTEDLVPLDPADADVVRGVDGR